MRLLRGPLILLAACSLSIGIPAGQLQDIAKDVLSVGHPLGSFKDARLVDSSPGGCVGPASNPTLDVDIAYRTALGTKDQHMVTRFTILATEPCEIDVQVLEDSGPAPVLLSPALLGNKTNKAVCEALTEGG